MKSCIVEMLCIMYYLHYVLEICELGLAFEHE